MRMRRRDWLSMIVVCGGLSMLGLAALGVGDDHPRLEIAGLAYELDGPGTNVDDPCWWSSPAGDRALLFVTTKDSGMVEAFEMPAGRLVGTIPGFGRPNNCAVHGNLLLTTDREPRASGAGPGKVKVHRIPDFARLRTFGDDMEAPHGIDVATVEGEAPRVYVTDSADASVHVYDLDAGTLVRKFSTGFGDGVEPILVDARHRRVFVGRGEKEKSRGLGVFDLEGRLEREFGADVFQKDAEGLALYACGDGGYLVGTDQHKRRTEFEVFDRVTLRHLATFTLEDGRGEFTSATDGIDILQTPLPGFPAGIFAACDGCGSNEPDEIDVIGWDRIAAAVGLQRCPGRTPQTGG